MPIIPIESFKKKKMHQRYCSYYHLSKLIRFFFLLFFIFITIHLIYFESESACGGHNVVIGLLTSREILALLGTLLFELKGCDVNLLAGLLASLLIVRFFLLILFFWL